MRQRDYSLSLWERVGVRVGVSVTWKFPLTQLRLWLTGSPSLRIPLPLTGRGNPMRQRDYSLSLWERVGVRVGVRVRVIWKFPLTQLRLWLAGSPSLRIPLPLTGRGNPMRQRDYSLSLWERVGVRVGVRMRVIWKFPLTQLRLWLAGSPSLRIPLPLTGARVQKERPIPLPLTGARVQKKDRSLSP